MTILEQAMDDLVNYETVYGKEGNRHAELVKVVEDIANDLYRKATKENYLNGRRADEVRKMRQVLDNTYRPKFELAVKCRDTKEINRVVEEVQQKDFENCLYLFFPVRKAEVKEYDQLSFI